MSVATTHTPPDSDVLDIALTYAALGLRVLPITPGQKHPPMREWQNHATADPAIITSWWTGLYRGHGIGILTGPASGTWVLDIDTAGGKTGAATIAELEATYGPLPATVEAVTGSGGRHLFYAWDPAHPVHNNQSGKAGTDVDIRGDGGQVVATPTIHPGTGRPYRWFPGHAPGEHPIAPAPEWLYALLERDQPPARPAPSRPVLTAVDDDDSPAAHFNASTTWDQLLTRDGWTLARTLGSGEQRWTRPGKRTHDGISATVGHEGRDVLKVFTPNAPGLDADGAYSRFGYEAAVRYHGDRSAFASELRRSMNQAAQSELTDMSWLSDVIATPAPESSFSAGATNAEIWPDPEPLEPELGYGPAFPLDVLPTWIADMAYEVSEARLVPADLPAVAILGALSSVVQTKVTLHASGTSWTEDSNLYLMCGYPSGGGKSPAFAAVMAPIEAFEEARIRQLGAEIEEATTRFEILSKKAKDKQESAAKGSIDVEEAIAARAAASAVVIPPSPAFIAEDATPEALGQHIAECGGVGALLSSEGDVVDMMAGQYAERGKGANHGVWLKSWGSESIRVKRVGRGVVRLPRSTLTMCVMPQPVLVRRLGENTELGERGLTARFLYSVPPSNVGHRDYRSLRRPGDDTVSRTYTDTITAIAERMARSAYPTTLRTTPDATDLFIEWLNATEARLRPGGDLEGMAGWVAKLRAQTLRIAALLHIADGKSQAEEVGIPTLERAFVVADYFIEHAKVVHAVWNVGSNPVLQRARKVVEWVVREGIEEFTASELQSKQRRSFAAIKDTVEPLTWLVEAGWLRAESGLPVKVGQPGKPSPSFTVRPDARACANGARPVDETDVDPCANGANPDVGPQPPRHSRLRALSHPRGEPLSGRELHVRYKHVFQYLSIYILNSQPPTPSDHTEGGLREGANGAEVESDSPATVSAPPAVAEPDEAPAAPPVSADELTDTSPAPDDASIDAPADDDSWSLW